MTTTATACAAPKDAVGGPRCGAAATWTCPSGLRCDACAREEMDSIRDGTCLLTMIAENSGVSRETLLSRYRRLS